MSVWPGRVAVLGAGAMGTLFTHVLKGHTSAEVWLLARPGHPGTVAVEGGEPESVALAGSGPADLLVVLVKAYDTETAVAEAVGREAVGPETVVLTLQNGLGNAEAVGRVVGPERVLAGTTGQGATLVGPGRVRWAGRGQTRIAAVDPKGPAAVAAPLVAALLTGAGLPAEVVTDWRSLVWAKAAVNCGINALTALLRVPNGELLTRPEARRLMEAAAREAGAVAAALGVGLDADPVTETLAVAAATAANRSSMLQDIERGRRTEIDAINGAVAKLGLASGVPTPVNQVLADLVQALGV